MKYLNKVYYVEVKAKNYIIHSTGKTKLLDKKIPRSLITHCQRFFETKIGRNQKGNKIVNEEMEVQSYRKKEKVKEKPKNDMDCASCKQRSWMKFDEK